MGTEKVLMAVIMALPSSLLVQASVALQRLLRVIQGEEARTLDVGEHPSPAFPCWGLKNWKGFGITQTCAFLPGHTGPPYSFTLLSCKLSVGPYGQHQHHLGTCWKCKFSSSTTDLSSQAGRVQLVVLELARVSSGEKIVHLVPGSW